MPYQFQNASILVVDDMKPMLLIVQTVLGIFGFKNIHTAMNADDAFTKFCLYNPDLVITDWQMDPYDGIELIDRIRNDPKSPNKFVPVILMTGYSARARVEAARDKGTTEFLVKPFSAKDLYTRIEQLIESPRKFVDAKEFFGPDRRRRRGNDYEGAKRRNRDAAATTEDSLRKIDGILDQLKGQPQTPPEKKDE